MNTQAPVAPVVQKTPDEIRTEWVNAQAQLRYWKEKEMELRGQVVQLDFAGAPSGTNRKEFAGGVNLKAVIKYLYSIEADKDVNTQVPFWRWCDAAYWKVAAALDRMDQSMIVGLIKWRPDFSEFVYKTLPDDQKAIINEVLTIKNGAAQVELEQPKVKQ